MRTARAVRLLAATSLLGVGAVAAACGGGGGVSVEEYFRQVQAVSDEVNARFDASERDLDAAFEDIEDPSELAQEHVDAVKENFKNNLTIIDDAVKGIDDLEPPDELREAHDRFRGALAEFQGAIQGFGEHIDEIESPAELQAFFTEEDTEFAGADERFQAACQAFEGVAREHDFELNLECDE